MTIEGSKFINLKAVILNFETVLINAVEEVVSNIRIIGCFYNFIRVININLQEKRIDVKLIKGMI